jgi:Putative transposase
MVSEPNQSALRAVTFVQRFGSSLNLNVHLHVVVLDGVFVEERNRRRRSQNSVFAVSKVFGNPDESLLRIRSAASPLNAS